MGDKWRIRSLRSCFAVQRIIAIEAKIDNWRRALRQAAMNLWFASSSFVLLPPSRKTDEVESHAEQLGVKIWTHGSTFSVTGSNVGPRSYASWLFNEWAWRERRG